MQDWPFLLLAGLILCAFFIISFSAQKFRLPSVLAFIIFGVIVADFIHEHETLHMAAEVGIVLLFFLFGLEFPLVRMMEIFKRVWAAGVLDVGLNLGGGLLLALLFQLDFFTGLVIGGLLYASSSSITLKMLEEQKRLANPETEFILALLIFEDLVAPVLVSFIAGLRLDPTASYQLTFLILLKIVLMVAGAIVIGHYGFRKLSDFISAHLDDEFMGMFTVGIALAYAGLAIALGLSEVLGAFLAGVMLSETGRASELEHAVLPIRNIALPFFFFWFGTTISLGHGFTLFPLMIVLIIWSVLGKTLVGFLGGQFYGLSRKVSVRAGFSLVQRGEFSVIIAGLAGAELRVFSGLYVLITASLGVILFQQAPALANWFQRQTVRQKAES